jgi:hypothetical protein
VHTNGGDCDDILVHDGTLEDAEFVVESPAANRVEDISPVEARALNTSVVTIASSRLVFVIETEGLVYRRTGRGEVQAGDRSVRLAIQALSPNTVGVGMPLSLAGSVRSTERRL